jgi:hypothetical protein
MPPRVASSRVPRTYMAADSARPYAHAARVHGQYSSYSRPPGTAPADTAAAAAATSSTRHRRPFRRYSCGLPVAGSIAYPGVAGAGTSAAATYVAAYTAATAAHPAASGERCASVTSASMAACTCGGRMCALSKRGGDVGVEANRCFLDTRYRARFGA